MRATLFACIAVATIARADAPPPALRVQYDQLDNGLRVVFAPDPSVSDVVVHVRYEEGAAIEGPKAGYTKLVERLFSLGTVHTKAGEFEQRIDAVGGWTTSATSLDDLTLTTQVPANALDLALFLEAERMAGLADGITAAGLATARGAVAAEYRAAYIDQPYGLVERTMRQSLWDDRMRADVLGDGVAVTRATLEDVRAFIRSRVQPDSTTLVVTGNFDLQRARSAVRRYFAWMPGTRLWRERPSGECWPRTVETRDARPRVIVAYCLEHHDVGHARLVARSLARDLRTLLVDGGLATEVRTDVIDTGARRELWIEIIPATQGLLAISDTVTAQVMASARDGNLFADRALRRAVEVERLLALETLAGRARHVALRWRADVLVDPTPAAHVREAGTPAWWERPVTVLAHEATP